MSWGAFGKWALRVLGPAVLNWGISKTTPPPPPAAPPPPPANA